jgi:hypothetical protein
LWRDRYRRKGSISLQGFYFQHRWALADLPYCNMVEGNKYSILFYYIISGIAARGTKQCR